MSPGKRFRFTLRRLMLAVAIAGLILGAASLYMRRLRFLRLAGGHAMQAAFAETTMGGYDHATTLRVAAQMEGVTCTEEEWGTLLANDRRRAEHHGRLRRKYARAARYPWLPVAPDPPEPE